MVTQFVGRKRELKKLESLYKQDRASIVVIKGRRRVGKSRLALEFAKKQAGRFWSFAGIAPEPDTSKQNQRDDFTRQLAIQIKSPFFACNDWSDAFVFLEQYLKDGDILFFDEISWMGSKDSAFIPKLKAWWDRSQKKVMLILCGSISTWVEENILKSTALFGRISLTMNLQPLTIQESSQLIKNKGFKGSSYEQYKLLSILGGIPWYLEQIKKGETSDEILKELCFESNGLLTLEFNRIFHDLFNDKGLFYRKILNILEGGMKSLKEIRKEMQLSSGGLLSRMMEQLDIAGFVKKQCLWSFKTKKTAKQAIYRIYDPYIHFYLKAIEPNLHKIEIDGLEALSPSQIRGFEALLGFQIETLLLQNRPCLLKAIGIDPATVINDGPFRQFTNTKTKGCQIDYLVQTTTNNLYICEFKFKRREIGVDIEEEIGSKVKALKIPRGFAPVPILFHIGGVSPSVATSNTFYRIIDIASFLEDE